MNILIKSTYPQTDGWGRAAMAYMECFYKTPHNVKSTPIVLSRQVSNSLPSWIKNVEPGFKPDVYFQQCLPDYFEPFNGKNIGFAFTETRNLQYTGWVEKFNDMDEVWVATQQEKTNLIKSGVNKKILVIPMPMELKVGNHIPYFKENIGDRYAFYFVGEYVERKNIEALISAYWREFSREEKVVLLIKTNYGGVETEQLSKIIQQNLDVMRSRMRLYGYAHHYPEILFIPEYLTDEEMRDLHATCDCFVNASRGESTCRPLIDAALHNNTILCTEGIGCLDNDLDIVPIKSYETPCSAFQPPMRNIYTGWETWMEVDQLDLQNKMRAAFKEQKKSDNKDKVTKYSYESVTRKIHNNL